MSRQGAGELARQGINPLPAGTLEEVIAAGWDPAKIGSCAKGNRGEIRGCPLWESCRFDRPELGGFKGTAGPRNVGYALTTTDGRSQMNYMPCVSFVRVVQARMDHGNNQRSANKTGEIIRIVAQEGEPIKMRVAVNKPLPPTETREELQEASAAALRAQPDRTGQAEFTPQTLEIVIPPFPRPGYMDESSFEAEVKRLNDEAERRENTVRAQMTGSLVVATQKAETVWGEEDKKGKKAS